ncbi:meiosis regulator and mRNA stability factor 1-like [Panonychus citri]|uniref:meiosis regulator and mRNA stability factor 1-like n=1 Tax=Panonychus citri TaxID=50023 RepID=UPI002307C9AD|nr:meiosis regulator and mRNA stability factor 1-like [Panonychus citri]
MHSTDLLRAEVISLFEDNPSKKLPFVTFQYFFEKNFHRSLTRADLRRLRDTIELVPDSYGSSSTSNNNASGVNVNTTNGGNSINCANLGGKYITLSGKYKATLSLPSTINRREKILPFCSIHQPEMIKGPNGKSPPLSSLSSSSSANHSHHGSKATVITLNGYSMINGFGDGWTDEEPILCLPLVNISLKKLGPRMHALLDSHSGCLPLASLLTCYFHQFKETFNTSDGSLVPLEHLITCLPGIEIAIDQEVSFKRVTWASSKSTIASSSASSSSSTSYSTNQPQQSILSGSSSNYSDVSSYNSMMSSGNISNHHNDSNAYNNQSNKGTTLSSSTGTSSSSSSTVNDTIARQMAQFSREVRDLLKSQPRCLIPFSKFVPAYHNHFGRQCCVYQYGYTKLIELLEAIPHVVQILGEGSKKMLTLTHREQTKRFASDLIRVLKAQPAKRLTLGELATKYEKVLEKTFSIENYGVCEVTDILVDVWEGTVVIIKPEDNNDPNEIVLEIPRKERTQEEIDRTKYLIRDIVELFQSTPTLSMPFSKFIPTYHHYFNRQCRVADYGFTKLIELFESLSPEVVELEDNMTGDEKIIKLSHEYRVKTIEGRLVSLIKSVSNCITPDCLHDLFKHEYGHPIHFRAYGVENMIQLIRNLNDTLKLVRSDEDRYYVSLVDRRWNRAFAHRIVILLMEKLTGSMSFNELSQGYNQRFGQHLDCSTLTNQSDLNEFIDIDKEMQRVSLNDYHLFARDCVLAIQSSHAGQVTLNELAEILRINSSYPDASKFGFKSFRALIHSLSDYITITKRSDGIRVSFLLTLNRHFWDRKLILSRSESPTNLLKRPQSAASASSSCSVSSASSSLSHCLDVQVDTPPLSSSPISSITLSPQSSTDSRMTQSSSSSIADCSEIIDILSESVPSHLPMPTILPIKRAPDLISFDSPTSDTSESMETFVVPSDNQQSPDHHYHSTSSLSNTATPLSTGNCPQPPIDWLKSFDNQEDGKSKSDSSRKVKPRRIAANFTSNNQATVC